VFKVFVGKIKPLYSSFCEVTYGALNYSFVGVFFNTLFWGLHFRGRFRWNNQKWFVCCNQIL